jgi:site-specific DNA-methyltransferase (adenine-specific)
MISYHKIIIGDSRNMEEIPDQSVHLIITSPPYWQLKDYGVENQIGFNDKYESYINHLNLVWNESYSQFKIESFIR